MKPKDSTPVPGVQQANPSHSLPPGATLSDIYMDASQVAQELNISKRTVRNMRVSSKLSWTTLFGKIFYFRQEIAGLLAANKIPKKNRAA